MNCTRVRSHLGDHLEGDLTLRFRTRVDEHLSHCASCARELSELRSTVGLLRSLPTPQPPAELASEIMRRIESGEARTWQSPAVVRRFFNPQVAAALAASLAGFAIFTSIE
ncbi:MAG: zf-HC2 domain-containing protein, partial [Deltaproteobacteria bacterium]|nr:zf-HC2 domain-containing protein [Deltaproteobacteria bacterium]